MRLSCWRIPSLWRIKPRGRNGAIGAHATYQFNRCWWLIRNALSVGRPPCSKRGNQLGFSPGLDPEKNDLGWNYALRCLKRCTMHLELQISADSRDVVAQSDETVSPSQELIILVGAKGAFSEPSLPAFSLGSRYGKYQRRKKWTWEGMAQMNWALMCAFSSQYGSKLQFVSNMLGLEPKINNLLQRPGRQMLLVWHM